MPRIFSHGMATADLDAILAYLRTLDPIRNSVPLSKVPPPVSAMLQGIPELPAAPATLAACADRHTPKRPDGSCIPGLEFAGGFPPRGSWGEVGSPNLTTHPSGIPHHTEEPFLKVMRTGDVGGRQPDAIMPWG